MPLRRVWEVTMWKGFNRDDVAEGAVCVLWFIAYEYYGTSIKDLDERGHIIAY